MTQPTQPQKLNGAQKLEALEKALADLTQKHDQQIQIIGDELNKLNERFVALAKRLNAILQASDSDNGLNSESVKEVMQNEEAKNLKAKVDMFVEQGVLVRNDEKVIDETTFVVGHETDMDGKMINPRTQFLVAALLPEAKAEVLGLKVGAVIKNDNIKQIMHIDETYDLVQPKQVQEASEEAPVEAAQDQAAGAEVIRTKQKPKKVK